MRLNTCYFPTKKILVHKMSRTELETANNQRKKTTNLDEDQTCVYIHKGQERYRNHR